MGQNYNERQAEWAKREKTKENEERKAEVIIGEVTGKLTRDIKKSDDIRVKIENVETLKLKPSVDLQKGDSIKITINADWSMRGQEKQRWGRERKVQAGEALGKVTGNIKKSDEIRVRIDDVETLKFKPSVDLKKNDYIRVTIGKVSEPPMATMEPVVHMI
jgi:hypothetical protein